MKKTKNKLVEKHLKEEECEVTKDVEEGEKECDKKDVKESK